MTWATRLADKTDLQNGPMSPENPRTMCTTDAVMMDPWDARIVTLNRCLRDRV